MQNKRKSQRLPHYDYSENGCYYVTVCTNGRRPYFRQSVGAATCRPHSFPPLTRCGQLAEQAILQIPLHYPHITVEKYVVMPNHLHMLLMFDSTSNIRQVSLSDVVGHMKRWVSVQLGFSPWQKPFHDHIIRDEHDFLVKWNYIDTNPQRWCADEFYIDLNI